MTVPNNNSNNNSGGDDQNGGDGKGGDNQNNGGTTTQGNQNGGSQNQSSQTNSNVDLKSLPADQIAAALENPALWETPRMKELLGQSKELKDLKDKASKDEDKRLEEQKKFEDLAKKRSDELATANAQIETMRINQSLTSLLLKENVVDLDAALQLVDRSALKLKDDGSVEGSEDAIKALKDGKSYLFNSQGGNGQPRVGTPSNQGNQGQSQGPAKFKRSQLMGPEGTKFYQDNKAEVDAAYAAGLVEDDVTPRR